MEAVLTPAGDTTLSPAPAATVLIVTYNPGAYLQACLDALAAQDLDDFEALIVDNASTDGFVEAVSLPDNRFRLLRQPTNLGFAAASNFGALHAQAAWLAMLNPDTVPEPGWLRTLLEARGRWPGAAAFGSTQVRLDQPMLLDGAGDEWHAAGVGWRALEGRPVEENPPEGETFSACAAAALYRRDVFLGLGGFDERYFCYCEDLDIGYRMRAGGWQCVQVRSAVVRHAGSATSGRRSDFTVFHGHRNRVWTFVKNTPGMLFWALLPAHVALNLLILWRSPTSSYRRAVIRAYWAAIRGLGPVFAERRRVQNARCVGALNLAMMLAWRPGVVLRRGALLREGGDRVSRMENLRLGRNDDFGGGQWGG